MSTIVAAGALLAVLGFRLFSGPTVSEEHTGLQNLTRSVPAARPAEKPNAPSPAPVEKQIAQALPPPASALPAEQPATTPAAVVKAIVHRWRTRHHASTTEKVAPQETADTPEAAATEAVPAPVEGAAIAARAETAALAHPAQPAPTVTPPAAPAAVSETPRPAPEPGSIVRGVRYQTSGTSRVGNDFDLVSVEFVLNGEPLPPNGDTPRSTTTIEVSPRQGSNTFEVKAVSRGVSHFPFTYLDHARIVAAAVQTFDASANDRVSITVSADEDHDLLKKLEDRFRVHIETQVHPVKTTQLDRQRP
jgi:hypothetical protein